MGNGSFQKLPLVYLQRSCLNPAENPQDSSPGLSAWFACACSVGFLHTLSHALAAVPKLLPLCCGQDRVCGRDGLQVTAAWEESVVEKATSVSGWGRVPADQALPVANHRIRAQRSQRAECKPITEGMRLWGRTPLVLLGGKFLSGLWYIHQVRITAPAHRPCWAVCKEQEE